MLGSPAGRALQNKPPAIAHVVNPVKKNAGMPPRRRRHVDPYGGFCVTLDQLAIILLCFAALLGMHCWHYWNLSVAEFPLGEDTGESFGRFAATPAANAALWQGRRRSAAAVPKLYKRHKLVQEVIDRWYVALHC